MFNEFKLAIDELAWRFGSAEGLCLRAQMIDSGRIGGVWDAAASARAVDALTHPQLVDDFARRQKIDTTLEKAFPDVRLRADVRTFFIPFGRASSTLDACFAVGQLNLLAVAVATSSASTGFKKKHGIPHDAPAPDVWLLLRWMEDEARSLEKAENDIERLRWNKPTRHVFERILTEASKHVEPYLTAYETVRREREKEGRDARERQIEADVEAADRLLWGTA